MASKKILFALAAATLLWFATPTYAGDLLNTHPVQTDKSGKLVSWVEPQQMAYDRVMRLAWDYLLHTVRTEPNGVKTYLTYCCMDSVGEHTQDWPHDPASIYGAFVDSATAYYAYSGDSSVLKLVQEMLDFQLANGNTPADWSWSNVPYSSADAGQLPLPCLSSNCAETARLYGVPLRT